MHPTVAPRRVMLLTHARTASNLLLKLLSNEPQLEVISYTFSDAFMFGDDHLMQRKSPATDAMIADRADQGLHNPSYQESFDKLRKVVAEAEEEGRPVLIKEHIYFILDPVIANQNISVPRHQSPIPPVWVGGDAKSSCIIRTNPTVLPDAWMQSALPVILIRHPALVIPSFYRAAADTLDARVDDGDFPVNATLRWSRLLFDWYLTHPPNGHVARGDGDDATRFPIVIDADDLMMGGRETETVRKLWSAIGYDACRVKYEWDPLPSERIASKGKMRMRFQGTILGSKGILAGKDARGLVVANEVEKWKVEFGDEVGSALAKYVVAAMPDYEYLRNRRLR